jgi:hypothetical protein
MNSEAITQRIWQHSKTTGVNKLMLLALAQHADEDGFCWPGYEALGAMVGLTGKSDSIKRNAMRNLTPVIETGEIMVWEQQGQHGGRGYTNIYLITVGLTTDQIREIVQRRFELQDNEVDTVLSKKGDKYITLCHLKRVSSVTLLRTRGTKKGDKSDTVKQDEVEKGDKSDTRTSLDSSLIGNNPSKENKREREEAHAQKLKRLGEVEYLSQNKPFAIKLSEICGNPGPEYVVNGDRKKLAETTAQLLDWKATIAELEEFKANWKLDSPPYYHQVSGQWGRFLTSKQQPKNGVNGHGTTILQRGERETTAATGTSAALGAALLAKSRGSGPGT